MKEPLPLLSSLPILIDRSQITDDATTLEASTTEDVPFEEFLGNKSTLVSGGLATCFLPIHKIGSLSAPPKKKDSSGKTMSDNLGEIRNGGILKTNSIYLKLRKTN